MENSITLIFFLNEAFPKGCLLLSQTMLCMFCTSLFKFLSFKLAIVKAIYLPEVSLSSTASLNFYLNLAEMYFRNSRYLTKFPIMLF